MHTERRIAGTARGAVARALLGLVLALAVVVAAPAQPAAAGQCAGTGRITTASSTYLPLSGPANLGGFVLVFEQGVCAGFGSSLSGTFDGTWCGLGTGHGPGWSMTWSGPTMTFTGSVVGELFVLEDRAAGESCDPADGGANRFIFAGALTTVAR